MKKKHLTATHVPFPYGVYIFEEGNWSLDSWHYSRNSAMKRYRQLRAQRHGIRVVRVLVDE